VSLAAAEPRFAALTGGDDCQAPQAVRLTLRYRVPVGEKAERFHTLRKPVCWDPANTAVIVCDMWDTHHSENAARRVVEVAPRMNELLVEMRRRGATIVHAPSNCMETYKDHPGRKLAMSVPRSENLPTDIAKWCYQIPAEEQGVYPLDQKDGQNDDDPQAAAKWEAGLAAQGRNPRHPWVKQIDTLTIHEGDFVSESGEEIWSLLEHRGIDNVMLVGVHTNMCVLGRPFGLRQMSQNGKRVVLCRDLTDTIYSPEKSPFVSHFTGTDLIVSHIEKYVCPTVTSDQVLGGKPFRFREDTRKRLVVVMAEGEYRTNESLPKFALEHLGRDYAVELVHGTADVNGEVPGVEALADADAVLVSVRRQALPESQLGMIREFVESGKPVVGIRTASHAFALRDGQPEEGRAVWPEFDRQVFGGNYHNHHPEGPKSQLAVAPGAESHPILRGVDVTSAKLVGHGSLYKVSPLTDSATPLLVGSIPGQASEPVAWTNTTKFGGRAAYTSLGHVEDFTQPEFNELLKNMVDWAVQAK
jgi:nicotinamidase-related amidase/type 1 glutamine amidotransferase